MLKPLQPLVIASLHCMTPGVFDNCESPSVQRIYREIDNLHEQRKNALKKALEALTNAMDNS
ncbi:MAG: hypothetical protein JEZ06_23790 [Anaerolineaceae bacterium]|nr:hypothetical protein [Anaerolineaceae bacterium]